MERITTVLSQKPKLLLFDVYETLLDMTYIQRKVNALFNSKQAYTVWFERLMQYCFVDNCIGAFHPFTTIATATLQMTGKTFGHTITESDAEDVIELFDQLPVNEGVASCISTLSRHGYKMAALTNASKRIIEDRMTRSGLISYFEGLISADEVKKYKPATEVYQRALQQLNYSPDDVLYVTTHAWDVAGAASAGLQTVYLKQNGGLIFPLGTPPALQFQNFEEFAQKLTNQFP